MAQNIVDPGFGFYGPRCDEGGFFCAVARLACWTQGSFYQAGAWSALECANFAANAALRSRIHPTAGLPIVRAEHHDLLRVLYVLSYHVEYVYGIIAMDYPENRQAWGIGPRVSR